MTLLEKIKNYKWFDSPNKLRAILEELYNSIGGGSGGGSQDLQSVLDKGSIINNENSSIAFVSPLDVDYFGNFAYINRYGMEVQNTDGLRIFSIINQGTNFHIKTLDITSGNTINSLFLKTNPNSTVISGNVLLPRMTGSDTEVTLATLDDIKKIDLTGRVYENNAAAISGGLTVNDVYRTSTGELRIVI